MNISGVLLSDNDYYTLVRPEKAEEISRINNAQDEDGWTYVPVHDPSGKGLSYINVYDSQNELLGKL